ncbi:ras-related and estrogen-regulated growth inhibitor-like protein [Dinothrombium tinctorium]|uniref:small monomeric GTPase n=1 Tax=Dinothrombium tinctorium TaxID=1965070 RepID=A0A3S3P3Q5_9ACAR|nr:ras-related and estrogen-regulated growth inhibitor-like protein [Dinothrombium tinctorium]
MSQVSSVKVLILGGKFVGKSDLHYKRNIVCDEILSSIEILDFSRSLQEEKQLNLNELRDTILWADGCVIVYSICDMLSFKRAQDYLRAVNDNRNSINVPVILLGNKRDLEIRREVDLKKGRQVAVQFGCQFYEISAADSFVGVSLAFENLIREIRSLNARRRENQISHQNHFHSHSNHSHNQAHNAHKKLSLITVSRVFGAVFGRNTSPSTCSLSPPNYFQCQSNTPQELDFDYKPKTSENTLNGCRRKKSVFIRPQQKQSLPVMSL